MTRSRDTSNTFIEQDQLGRTYLAPEEPTRDKERLGDMWLFDPNALKRINTKRTENSSLRSVKVKRTYRKIGSKKNG